MASVRHLVASIPSPPSNGIQLGPLFVHAYGLAYVLALVAAVALTSRRWERAGGDRDLVREVAVWGFPAGLVGGRLYFLATSWNQVPDHWWGPLAVWRGDSGSGAVSPAGRSRGSSSCTDGAWTSHASWTRQHRRCWSPRRSAASVTTSTRSSSGGRRTFPGQFRSHRPTARPATKRSPPSTRPFSTS